jgi:hypothetical protein
MPRGTVICLGELSGLLRAQRRQRYISSAELALSIPLQLGELLDVPEPPYTCSQSAPVQKLSYAGTANLPTALLAQAPYVYVLRGGRVLHLRLAPLYIGPYGLFQRHASLHTQARKSWSLWTS